MTTEDYLKAVSATLHQVMEELALKHPDLEYRFTELRRGLSMDYREWHDYLYPPADKGE